MMQNKVVSKRKTVSFFLLWLGQFVSVTGSALTGFSLGVWIYQTTGSTTQYALSGLFFVLPNIILSPIAGTLVDRWNRRWAMMISDVGAGLGVLIIWLLFQNEALAIWHIYVIQVGISICNSLQWPAYTSAVTLLVPKEQLGRANGIVQLGEGVGLVLAPVLAGFLITIIDIDGIFLIDLSTFSLAFITLLLVRIPKPPPSDIGQQGRGAFWQETAQGWRFIRSHPGLLTMLLFFAGVNFSEVMVEILIIPLVLGFANESALGGILSFAGLGLLLGAVFATIWGGPKRLVLHGILAFTFLRGFILLLGGIQPNGVLVAIAAFVFLFSSQLTLTSAQVIWQRKVPPDIQGRVFAMRRMISGITAPLAYFLAGPLADFVFEPLLMPDGLLAGNVGRFIGTGQGRGIGLLFILLGILLITLTVGAYHMPRFFNIEEELPDAI